MFRIMKHNALHAFVCGALLAVPALSSPVKADLSSTAPCVPALGAVCAGNNAADYTAMMDRLRAADIVVVGERHDNPAHHDWQARIIGALEPKGLAFEMIPQAKEDAANAARSSGGDLEAALDWANSGWPAWEMYAPLFDAAPKAVISGGGIPRETLRASVGDGAAAAFGDGSLRYQLEAPLAEDMQADMEAEQAEAHCGALPDVMLPGMVEAQRLRDAAFADAALRLHEQGDGPLVLIVGNGHARIDRGAPLYLGRAAPGLDVVAIGLLEHENTPVGVPFDYVIYTAKHDRGDPCEAFLKSREKSD
jgi:uncharacterized iron-regulated protein